MERKKILSLLELPDNSPDQKISERLNEKICYHETLINNSNSAFVKRLNKHLLEKIIFAQKDIQNFLQQSALLTENKIEIDKQIIQKKDEALSAPLIHSLEIDEARKKVIVNEPIAYLIIHSEGQAVKTYPLFIGKNYIGRQPHHTLQPFVALEDDEFTSRIHAAVNIDHNNNDRFYYIEDSAESNEGKPSKNGTFLNGKNKRITGKTQIEDDDTIQVGETKLIFKINSKSLEDIMQEVKGRDYMHTIVIRI